MKKIFTTLSLSFFLFLEITFSQTVIFSENFESGTANTAWGVYYKGEETILARPMAQAPAVLATGGNYVGLLQDINGSYTGSAVVFAGANTLQNYSIEADVYCYVNHSGGSAYTGLVVYADSSSANSNARRDFYKMRVDFDASNRINFSGLKSDPATFLPVFNYDFKGADNPGRFPTTSSWHKLKIEVRTINATTVRFWCYLDNQQLTNSPLERSTTGNTTGSFGLYSFQMDADGIAAYFDNIVVTQLTTSVEDNEKVPTEFSLLQNYPNPFNPQTQISYKLSAGGFISLSIYDLLGREIKTLVSKDQPAGSYTVSWNGKNEFGNAVPSGVYMYSLKAGNFHESKKMILMK